MSPIHRSVIQGGAELQRGESRFFSSGELGVQGQLPMEALQREGVFRDVHFPIRFGETVSFQSGDLARSDAVIVLHPEEASPEHEVLEPGETIQLGFGRRPVEPPDVSERGSVQPEQVSEIAQKVLRHLSVGAPGGEPAQLETLESPAHEFTRTRSGARSAVSPGDQRIIEIEVENGAQFQTLLG
jgi:hypothetical protein